MKVKVKAPKKFTHAECRRVRDELTPILAEICQGMTVDIGGGKFDEKEYTAKLVLTIDNPDLTSVNERAYENLRKVHQYLPPMGTTVITTRHGVLTVTGYRPKAPTYPIEAKNERGTTYVWRLTTFKDCREVQV